MSAGWQERRLGDVLVLEYGKPLPPEARARGGKYAVYGANGVKARSDKFYCDKPSIIVGRKGSAGEITLTEDKFWPLDVTYFVTFDESKYDLQFLYYLLSLQELTKLAKGVKPGINRNEVYAKTVRVPSLPEQQRVVAILDEAFAGLATATANAEKNLKNARELPVSVFAFIFKNGALRWPTTTIGDQVTLQRGFDITKRQQSEGRVPVVSSGGIKSFHDTFMARGPGVVLGRKGSLGTVFYVDQDYWPHDTTLWVKDFKGNHPRFVYCFFKSLDLAKLDSGAANPALNRNVVHPLSVNWPSRKEQTEIVQQIELISSNAERLASIYQRSSAAIAALKQSILQKAFSGELTSPPSQAIQEAAE